MLNSALKLAISFWLLLAFWSSSAAQTSLKPELHRQAMHSKEAATVAFSRGSQNIFASGSEDGDVKIYDAATGFEIRTLRGHTKQIFQIVFSPNGELLASASEDGSARFWRVATGESLFELKEHGAAVTAVAFSADGKQLASGGWDKNVRLWNAATGEQIKIVGTHENLVTAIAFNPTDKNLLASGNGSGEIKFWNVETSEQTKVFTAHEGTINSLDFNQKGDLLASGGADYLVKLWDAKTGTERKTFAGHEYAVSSVAFNLNGDLLASGSRDATIKIWKTENGQLIRNLTKHKINVSAVDFSADGKTIVSTGSDETIRLWNAENGEERRVLQIKSFAGGNHIAISADGKRLAIGVREIKLWKIGDGQELQTLGEQEGFVTGIAFSGDGETLATASEDKTVKLWNVRTGGEITTLRGHVAKVIRVIFSADGKLLASLGDDDEVKIWDVETRSQLYSFVEHPSFVTALAFSADGKKLVCGHWKGDVKMWDVERGRPVWEFSANQFTPPIGAVSFSRDGNLIATGERMASVSKIKLRNAANGKFVAELVETEGDEVTKFSHNGDIESLKFSADGKRLFSTSADASVKIWNVADKKEIVHFKKHSAAVRAVSLSADETTALSGSVDGEFILWRTTDGTELARLVQVDDGDWLAVTPDGLFDGSPAAWRQLLWRFGNNTFDYAPVEIFFSEFYRPGLFKEFIEGKRPLAPRDFAALDRRQPQISLSLPNSKAAIDERNIPVSIEITEAAADKIKNLPAGDVRDVRLFRNGSLVRLWRGDSLEKLKEQGCRIVSAVEKVGRRAICQTTISIVSGENRLTAYAFNRDNVKSNDGTATVEGKFEKKDGTLYVLAIGVNRYTDENRNLKFAVADVEEISGQFKTQQGEKLKKYAHTEIINLLDENATRHGILLALKRFGGEKAELPPNIAEELQKIKPMQPEDALIIYFAGHGTASRDRFYLIPHDGFPLEKFADDRARLEKLYAKSISDEDLEKILETIDVGKMMMVIDACNSGQAIETEEKRRGPMNSRGLAQLAYEKGMYILTASESWQAAREGFKVGSKPVRHGLLTYALLEGLQKAEMNKANEIVERKWLDYAVREVPTMQLLKMQGCRDVGKDCAINEDDAKITELKKRSVQSPRIFYRRELEADPLVVAKP